MKPGDLMYHFMDLAFVIDAGESCELGLITALIKGKIVHLFPRELSRDSRPLDIWEADQLWPAPGPLVDLERAIKAKKREEKEVDQ
jgi:hypothetical protein